MTTTTHAVRAIALGLLGLLGADSAAAAQDASPARTASVLRVEPDGPIAAVLLGAEGPRAARELAALGVESIHELFGTLRDGRLPIRVGEHGSSFRALDAAQIAALEEAFALLPRFEVLAFLEGLAHSDGERTERCAALQVVGAFGGRAQLRLLARLAEPSEPTGRIPRAVRDAFAQALARCLARDPSLGLELADRFRELHPALLAGAIESIGREAEPARLELLGSLLGREPEADVFVLIEIGKLAGRLPHPLDERLRAPARAYLSSHEPQLALEAALAAERLDDQAAMLDLAYLLDHADVNVRDRAWRSLMALSDRRIPPLRERWTAWLDDMSTWWAGAAQSEFAALAHGPASEVAASIMEISKRRFFRHELTAPLSAVLRRSEPELVELGCAALGHLGSRTAIPELIEVLAARPEEKLQAAAWHALKRITGSELGPDARLWREAFLPSGA